MQEQEQKARLMGLVAVLGLPPVRSPDGAWKRVPVEVEIAPDIWERVDSLVIEAERFVFLFGANGSQVQWVFKRSEGVPQWRTIRESTFVGFGGNAG